MIYHTCGIEFAAGDPTCTECLRKAVSGVRSIMRAPDIPETEEEKRLLYRLIRSMQKEAYHDEGK